MANITGNYLFRYLAQKVQESYSSYLSPSYAQRLFLDAFLSILKREYDTVQDQEARDAINFLIKTEQSFSLNNNRIYERPLTISSLSLIGATASLTTILPHNLILNDTITITGVQGFAGVLDGTYTATPTGTNSLDITVVPQLGAYIPNSGSLYAVGKQMTDYWEMIQVSARYDVLYQDLLITAASSATPIVIKVNKRSNLRSGQRVFISGVTGNLDANNDRYIKKLNDYTFALYKNANLTDPTVGTTTYNGGGVIFATEYNECRPFYPKTQISVIADPTVQAPKWKDSEKYLKFFPTDPSCTAITIDYYAFPSVVIDPLDTSLDLSNFYNEKFLMYLVDRAATLFAIPARDPLLYQQSAQTEATDQ